MASRGLDPEFVRGMTVEQLAGLPQATVGTDVAAHFLEMDRYNVTLMARAKKLPDELQNHCHFSGNRLHIMKSSLLTYLGYAN